MYTNKYNITTQIWQAVSIVKVHICYTQKGDLMRKATLTLVAIVCLVCLAVGLVACNLGDDDMGNLTEKQKCAKVLNAFIDYFIPQQTASNNTTTRRRGVTSAEGAELTIDDVLTNTLQPSTYDGAQRLSLPLTYSYFITKLCENKNFVIGDKPVAFVATETPGYSMNCIVQFSYDETADKLTLYLYDGRALMYGEIYYDEKTDTIKDFLLHGNKVGATGSSNGVDCYMYMTIQKKGNSLKEGDSLYYPATGKCVLQGVSQENAETYGEYHVNLLDGILNDFLQKAEDKDTLTTDFGEEMSKTSLFSRDLLENLINGGNHGGGDDGDDDDGGDRQDNITQEQWNQALDESSFVNFTANWTISGEKNTHYAEVDLANNKYKLSDESGNEVYFSKENKSYYKYQKYTGDAKFTRYSIAEDEFIWRLKGTESTLALEAKNYFNSFHFDEDTGRYVGNDIQIENLGACDFQLEFSTVSGKLLIAKIVIDKSISLCVYYMYDNASVTLPQDFDIDDGGSTQEPSYTVDSTDWTNALNIESAQNFTAIMTITDDNREYVLKANLKNNKYEFNNNTGEHIVYAKVGDNFYSYTKGQKESTYVRKQTTETDFQRQLLSLEQMAVVMFQTHYQDFVYNSDTKTYVGNDVQINDYFYNVNLRFENKKLVFADIELSKDFHLVVTYSYDNATIKLPLDYVDGGSDIKDYPFVGKTYVCHHVNCDNIDDYSKEIMAQAPGNQMITFLDNANLRLSTADGKVDYLCSYVFSQDTVTATIKTAKIDGKEDASLIGTTFQLKSSGEEFVQTMDMGNGTVIEFYYQFDEDAGNDDIPIERIYFNEKETSMLVGENIPFDNKLTIEPKNATDITLKWESSNTDILTVDEKGNVQSHAVGTVTITATAKNGRTATITVRVDNMPDDDQDEPISITLTQTNVTMRVNDVVDLDANILPITVSTANVKWSSTNSAVAWVDERGVVTALEEGTTTIIAMTDNGLTAECTVLVEGVNDDPKDIPVDYITITPDNIDMRVGETVTLNATVYPENATNKNFYFVCDPEFVEITNNPDGSCTIRALREGYTNVQAIAESNEATGGCNITIHSLAESIHLYTTTLSMNVGETAIIYATVDGNIQANLQWLPGNDMVASIESTTATSCTIHARESGDATITLVYVDDYNNYTDIGTCYIYVNSSPYGESAGKSYRCYDIVGNVTEDEYPEVDKVRNEMSSMLVSFGFDGTFRMAKDDNSIVITGTYSPLDSNVMLSVSQYTCNGIEDPDKSNITYILMFEGSGYVLYINTASGGTIECRFSLEYAS